jgi:hypothetical protein
VILLNRDTMVRPAHQFTVSPFIRQEALRDCDGNHSSPSGRWNYSVDEIPKCFKTHFEGNALVEDIYGCAIQEAAKHWNDCVGGPEHADRGWPTAAKLPAGVTLRDHDHRRETTSGAAAEIRRKIARNASQSTPHWPARVVPPKGAPNILLNCRTSVEMIEEYYAAHIKPRSTPLQSMSCGRRRRKSQTQVA